MFEAIATSKAPEYRRVNELPADAAEQVRVSFPEADVVIEDIRTYLPDRGEEVLQANLIVRFAGYSPCFITTGNELADFLGR